MRSSGTRAKVELYEEQNRQLCRNVKGSMCSVRGETVWYIVMECPNLIQCECKRCNDNIARTNHWELSGNHDLERVKWWYQQRIRSLCQQTPGRVTENERCKILWDALIQCDHMTRQQNPDIAVVNKL